MCVPLTPPSPDVNYEELARCTDDFNGAQCKAVCVEAVSGGVRRVVGASCLFAPFPGPGRGIWLVQTTEGRKLRRLWPLGARPGIPRGTLELVCPGCRE